MSVRFETANGAYQKIFDTCTEKLRGNLIDFGPYRVLVEGGGYEKIWLETQPMGGEMYAGFDMEAGWNNSLLFLKYQRADGRMPGSIALRDGRIVPEYNKFQGFCFPWHAMNMVFFRGRQPSEMQALRDGLMGMHDYLCRFRRNPLNGALRSFCVYDTGEDNAVRYGNSPNYWTEDQAPEGLDIVPMDSMDVTSWDYAICDTLCELSELVGNRTEAEKWSEEAEKIRKVLERVFWDPQSCACFDRDAKGRRMPQLIHNSLRCMYWGSFTNNMAACFVREHLLNPKEFWTKLPLPSVSVSDPDFRNAPENNWSGQCEGLTYQRAILALERYGLYGVVTQLGRRFLHALSEGGYIFTQQFDPWTGQPTRVGMISHAPLSPEDTSPSQDAYGPTMLGALEYLSHMTGIDLERDRVLFSAVRGERFVWERREGEKIYLLVSDGEQARGFLNGKQIVSFPAGYRYVVDEKGVQTMAVHNLEG